MTHFLQKMPEKWRGEYYDLKLFFVILKLKYWVQTFHTYQWINSDCLQAIGWTCLRFFDWLNLHFACRDRIGTGQNRPFYPCFGSHRGSRCGKNWFGMMHQIVRYVNQPLWPYAIQQQKQCNFYYCGESGFLGRPRMLGINLLQFHSWWSMFFALAENR